jgi:GNAT superfamily N-acetyltransferase
LSIDTSVSNVNLRAWQHYHSVAARRIISLNVENLSDDLKLRSATNADAAEVRALVFGILTDFGLEADVDGTDRDLFDIEANYLRRGGVFEVIENTQGSIVGTIGLYPLDDETIELRKMYFASEVRGSGLGQILLQKMIEKAKNLGYLRVYLETASVLKQAVHIYEKAGFMPIAEKHTPRCDQAYILELAEK